MVYLYLAMVYLYLAMVYLYLDLDGCTRTWMDVPGPGWMYPDLDRWTWTDGPGQMDLDLDRWTWTDGPGLVYWAWTGVLGLDWCTGPGSCNMVLVNPGSENSRNS